MAEPTVIEGVRVTRYEVSLLPESYADADSWAITVEYCRNGTWGVFRGRRSLGSDGLWDWENGDNLADDDWLASHRFGLETALKLAREYAPKVSVNGLTPADIFARHPELAASSLAAEDAPPRLPFPAEPETEL